MVYPYTRHSCGRYNKREAKRRGSATILALPLLEFLEQAI